MDQERLGDCLAVFDVKQGLLIDGIPVKIHFIATPRYIEPTILGVPSSKNR